MSATSADVVMTADGDIRGILIDVGGFLGIGARTVMVDIDELHFVLDHQQGTTGGWFDDTADDFFIVAAMSEAELEALPEFDEAMLRGGFETRRYQPTHAQEGMVQDGHHGSARNGSRHEQPVQQPAQDGMMVRTQAPDGFQPMAQEQLTADTLMGANVWDGQNQQIGQVEDLVLAADGAQIEAIVLDVGGFIGIGTHRVALNLQEVDIFWGDAQQEVRVQVPMTQEQLEQMPELPGLIAADLYLYE
jgi:sporulation protein YlmC with PRC-barrel domain